MCVHFLLYSILVIFIMCFLWMIVPNSLGHISCIKNLKHLTNFLNSIIRYHVSLIHQFHLFNLTGIKTIIILSLSPFSVTMVLLTDFLAHILSSKMAMLNCKHRHLNNVIHCLLFKVNAPLSFWLKALVYVTYIINMLLH